MLLVIQMLRTNSQALDAQNNVKFNWVCPSLKGALFQCFHFVSVVNSIHIFFANEVSLSSALAIVSLIPIIWLVSLPLRRLMLSCLTFRLLFSLLILFLMSFRMPSSYSGLLSQISVSLHFFLSMCCCN